MNVPSKKNCLDFFLFFSFFIIFFFIFPFCRKNLGPISISDDESTAKTVLIILYVLIETSPSIPCLFLSFLFSLVCLTTACLNSVTTGAASNIDLLW